MMAKRKSPVLPLLRPFNTWIHINRILEASLLH